MLSDRLFWLEEVLAALVSRVGERLLLFVVQLESAVDGVVLLVMGRERLFGELDDVGVDWHLGWLSGSFLRHKNFVYLLGLFLLFLYFLKNDPKLGAEQLLRNLARFLRLYGDGTGDRRFVRNDGWRDITF